MSRVRPSVDATLMATAHVWELRSTCDRNQVGVVIARDNRIVATGYNGAPAGQPHCRHMGPAYPALDHNQRGCQVAVHAEANAIAYSARHGVPLEGCTMYTTISPCYPCAQMIITAGLVRMVYDKLYRDQAGMNILTQSGIVIDRI